MKKNLVFGTLGVLILLGIVFMLQPQKPIAETGFESEIVLGNLDTPWAIDFLPDGRMIFTERRGRVSIWDGKRRETAGTIEVSEVSESGLMGIAVDPAFDENRFVYLYYTTRGTGNRVSRFVLNEQNKLQDEFILLDGIPSAKYHDGGRITFGPDGKLYITTGDATDPPSAQDLQSVAGKLLRMNSDGSIPEDNPFGNAIWSYGHRNSQGIDWHPESGALYSAEHGPTRNDELNILVKGGNYGWPSECDEPAEGTIDAIRCFAEFTLAPGGIAFYNNDLYIAGLRGNQVRRIVFAPDGKTILREEALFSELGRIREVIAHGGYLYIATSNRDGRGRPRLNDDKIIRVKTQ